MSRPLRKVLAPLGLLLLVAGAVAAPHLSAQNAQATYEDENARDLVEGVLATRAAAGPRGQATIAIATRSHVGLLIPNQWNWRHRTLYHKEVAGFLTVENRDIVATEVLGRTRGAPLIGNWLLDNPPVWGRFGFDPEEDEPALLGVVGLALREVGTDLPHSDSLPDTFHFFDSTFVDPMGNAGPETYRYRMGPDLVLPEAEGGRLLAVEFVPKDGLDPNFAGVLWFDPETKLPVRAMFRPSSRWRLRGGLRGFVRRIPLLPKDATGKLEFVTWDYRIDSQGVPVASEARVAGEMFMFWDQAIFPVDLDWAFDWSHPDPTNNTEPPPALEGGWSLDPKHDFDRAELYPFLRELDRAGGTMPPPGWKPTVMGALTSTRFNQVQGVNFTVSYPLPVGPTTTLEGRLEIPTSGFQPTGALDLRHTLRPWNIGVSGYSRLRDANWMEPVNGVTNTIGALLTGYDDGNYYLADGGALVAEIQRRPVDLVVEAFGEYQSEAPRLATYSLFTPDPDQELPPEIEVDPGSYFGLRARMDLQLGDDPQRGVAVVRVYASAVGGSSAYSSLGTTSDLIGPLPGPFTGAARVTLNVATGNVPNQALFYLGGTKTVRGYAANTASGASSLILTGEIGTSLPLIRLIAFGDLGYAGDWGQVLRQKGLGAVGGGISIGDGALRVDFARGVTEGGVWRLHILSSALF